MPHPEKQTHRKTTIAKGNTRPFLILFIIIIKLVRLAPPAISRHERAGYNWNVGLDFHLNGKVLFSLYYGSPHVFQRRPAERFSAVYHLFNG